MTRDLARQKDRPPVLVIGLTDTQRYYRIYNQDEINRLNREIKNLKRRHNAEIKDLNDTQRYYRVCNQDEINRLNREIKDLKRRHNAEINLLEMFREILSLDCPRELSRRTTILECAGHRERQECIMKNCDAQTKLRFSLYHFFKK